MIISRNLSAMNINRIANNNISAHAKSTEKVSSGYKINLAVDNPVGMAMSETMRRQIRGLMQATNNTKDGVAFVQIADGAMSEIHDMLQRMNELTIKALNGTCTDSDRAALNAEFDQLRTEIDRINNNTTFNEQPVFEEHESSYYQICGSKQWDDNQRHTITETTNDLTIRLPDSYVPSEYTITVPAGTYTTQELIDEIDDALNKLSPPNPGFVFEYTRDGYCNLNFERADGGQTKIEFVDGSLAYLIYDFKTGGSAATLLGTTGFGPGETLQITKGKNDVLGFYAERAGISEEIYVTLDQRRYTYDDLFNTIKSQLEEAARKTPIAADIKVETYEANGKKFIQITGGNDVNITGLKGNMFRVDVTGTKYNSVFYDNAIYGECSTTSASITGNYYLNSYPILITDSNNKLKFDVGDSENPIEITFNSGSYTVPQIVSIINNNPNVNTKVTASSYYNSTYGYKLKLTNISTGNQSVLDFQSFFDNDDSVYKKTYDTLFRTTSNSPTINSGQPLSLTGAASLSGNISITADSLEIYVNDQPCTIDGIKGDYVNLTNLVNKLKEKIPDEIKNKISFVPYSGKLRIISQSSDVKSIEIKDTDNAAYKTLFTASRVTTSGWIGTPQQGYASESPQEGNLAVINHPSSVTAYNCKSDIKIDSSNNIINIKLTHSSQSPETIQIVLGSHPYSIDQLVNEIKNNPAIKSKNISVTYSGSTITFGNYMPSNTVPGDSWTINTDGSAWEAIFQTQTSYSAPTKASEAISQLTSYSSIPDSITIDGSNNKLNLELTIYGTKFSVTANLEENKTYTRDELKSKLYEELNNNLTAKINGDNRFSGIKIEVSYNGSNQLVIKAPGGSFSSTSGSGSFYTEVMCKVRGVNESITSGKSTYAPDARIIGRVDLTKEPVKIIKDTNDQITFDFTYPGSTDPLNITITLPPGEYANGIALFGTPESPNEELMDIIQKQIKDYNKNFPQYADRYDEIQRLFGEDGIFDLVFSVGKYDTHAANSVDTSALQISVRLRDEANVSKLSTGEYILDGVRGSAAPFVFYKTTSLPTASYIIGTKNVMNGVTIEAGKNVLTLSVNSTPYQYTFPEDTYYTADQLIDLLNNMFENGDDYGNPAPLEASLENGMVKISHKLLGSNKITNVGGSARSTIFFEEEGRDERDPLILQVGSEQRETIELPRILVNSCSLGINSITISQLKYAEKAVNRIKDAINLLNSKRSTYGAMQNRLEHTINNNENVTESVQKTESIIRDTDIASEMIRYSNLSILLQASQNAIVQSNQNIQKLLTILQ